MSIATKCTCHMSSNGICNSSVKECTQLINPNTQLPDEVKKIIKTQAKEYAAGLTFNSAWVAASQVSEFRINAAEDWDAGATEYATKLNQANETIKVLEYDNKQLKGELEGYKEAIDEAQSLIKVKDRIITGLCQQGNKMEQALKIVQQWQLPSTGQFWDKEQTQPMSYGACYGSNGERDFMRNVANQALQDAPAEQPTIPKQELTPEQLSVLNKTTSRLFERIPRQEDKGQ